MEHWSDQSLLFEDVADLLGGNSRLMHRLEGGRVQVQAVEVEDREVQQKDFDALAWVGRHIEIDTVADCNSILAG